MKSVLYRGLEAMSLAGICLLSLLLLAVIGVIDYNLGPEISTSLLYIFPVSLVAWFGGRHLGLGYALLASLIWGVTDIGSGMHYSHLSIAIWNSLMRLIIFALIAGLMARLRQTLKAETMAADSDPATGLLNRRGFNDALKIEFSRSARSGRLFSLAYIDVDHFKQVNDQQGHKAGDQLLAAIAQELSLGVRITDRVARLGGDEFAILLPETDPDDARAPIENCRTRLSTRVAAGGWPVTFSIGVITFSRLPEGADQAISRADALMYEVKKSGKNRVSYRVWNG